MRFVLMLKMDTLGASRERNPPDVTLRPLEDVFGAFLQKPKTIKQQLFRVLGTHLVK